jgi:hypothetical protein
MKMLAKIPIIKMRDRLEKGHFRVFWVDTTKKFIVGRGPGSLNKNNTRQQSPSI